MPEDGVAPAVRVKLYGGSSPPVVQPVLSGVLKSNVIINGTAGGAGGNAGNGGSRGGDGGSGGRAGGNGGGEHIEPHVTGHCAEMLGPWIVSVQWPAAIEHVACCPLMISVVSVASAHAGPMRVPQLRARHAPKKVKRTRVKGACRDERPRALACCYSVDSTHSMQSVPRAQSL